MEKPSRKQKKVFVILGAVGVVYAGFYYLLPLAAPFFAGYLIALALRPSARFLSYRLRVRIFGKMFQVPASAVGGAEFLAILAMLGAGICLGVTRLVGQVARLMEEFPDLFERAVTFLRAVCGRVASILGFSGEMFSEMVLTALSDAMVSVQEKVMPFLVERSAQMASWGARAMVFCLVTFLAVILAFSEMDDLKDSTDRSLFRRELSLVSRRIATTGKAWFRTQGILLVLISMICVLGMAFLGNPYYLLSGIGLGVLDALPLFGTGTALVPWAIVCLIGGRWKRALFLLALYLICYLVRQFLETHMMAGQVGLSPLQTLAAVYVGLELFGLWGLFLGPLGILLVEDLVGEWMGEDCKISR